MQGRSYPAIPLAPRALTRRWSKLKGTWWIDGGSFALREQ
jgi:hypothetical protein